MDWIGITCWTLSALFWDRARGRIRCRKCAYDMSGGGLVCPECGREHKSERVLRKTRRKWKTAVFGVMFGSLSYYPIARQELTIQEGAWGLVPTLVLAAMCDPQDYMKYGWSSSSRVTAVFSNRIDNNLGTGWTRALWASRLRNRWEESLPASDATLAVAVIDMSSIAPVSRELKRWRGTNCFVPYGRVNTVLMRSNGSSCNLLDFIFETSDILDDLREEISPDQIVMVGDRIVIAAKPEIIQDMRQRLAQLKSHQWWFGAKLAELEQDESQCCVLYRFNELPRNPNWYEDERGLVTIMAALQRRCRPDDWVSVGGADALQAGVGNAIAISARADHHQEIAAYLNSSEFKAIYATVIDSSR